MQKLDQFFEAGSILRNAEFATLGYADARPLGTLAFSDGIKYVRQACQNPAISCIITTQELASFTEGIAGVAICKDPREAFYKLHERWVAEKRYQLPITPHRGVNCRIHPSAIVADGCWIGDHVVIGENVVIRQQARIGSHVIMEPGARIAMEGILYHRTPDGPRMIPHGGYVEIEDHAVLMSGSTVVRSIHDTDVTRVGHASIIGLNSVVGHEAKVGDHVVVSNQCVLARRCVIGKGAFIGTGSFVREHVKIGEHAQVMAGSIVITNVADHASVSGNFTTEHQPRMLHFAKKLRDARTPSDGLNA
ncbi:UDP-3-O-[3-hydroxymyristoyl] glucosamine N-acyltransferase [Prosthecobacter fusiformis]|uniref:UDP-3-O-[3-hydroxymyristoyl] glucosamine N-acyltransferase n=1 Tax=Prosthecobacter fusiformis TaxID=48464 RepID=A0A4R7RU24_9BACT|nr:hypothetical protein [Prosthecobacter fusiformis]TDU69234.1 UDP-3-O-[3-hydroxymyristoyl] glucosamine N-acyltransferase [Prosthecobacter fusiformis]